MTSLWKHSPRRYFVDANGCRVLIGLTVEETFEFEAIDKWADANGLSVEPPGSGDVVAHQGRERRWLELYGKHDAAWADWKAKMRGDRRQDSAFVNYG